LRRLYIARDRDRDGRRAAERLRERAQGRGIAVVDLVPVTSDFNTDLMRLGRLSIRQRVLPLLSLEDAL
jgi:hypothetical protein